VEFSNHDELGHIEAALRFERPRLRGELESAICGRVGGARSGGGRRAGLAVVLSVGTLVAMSGFGGVGYASFGFDFNPFHPYHSPFKDQYGKGGKKDHKPHGNKHGKHGYSSGNH